MDAKYIKCAAKCCGNRLLDRSDLTFFTFPEDDKLAKQWARNANIPSYQYGSTLCSEHFEDKYFVNTTKKKSVFRQNVEPIPTIFNQGIKEEINIDSDDNATSQNEVDPLAPLDFQGHCRLCANYLPASSLISLFDTSNNFSELLDQCLPGKVKVSDALPHAICMPCAHKLVSCAATLKSFKEADKKLRDIFETQPSTSQEKITPESTLTNKITQIDSDNDFDTKMSVDGDDDDFDLSKDDLDLDEVEAEDILNVLENVLEETNKILDEIVPDEILEDGNRNNDILDTRDIIMQNMKKIMGQKKEIIKFKCIICSSGFNTKEKMMVHAFHDHPEFRDNKLISNVIKSTVNVQDKEQNTDYSVPTIKKYQCVICSIETPTEEGIIKHTQKNHKSLVNDKILTKVVEVPETFSIKYMCVSCPKVFNTKKQIQDHAYFMHPSNTIISKTIKMDNAMRNQPDPKIVPLENHDYQPSDPTKQSIIFQNDNISKIRDIIQGRSRKRWDLNLNQLVSYELKYKCKFCTDIYETYQESLEHFAEAHTDCKLTEIPVTLVKVSGDEVVPVEDGTIFEANPAVVEKRPSLKKTRSAVKFKCLQCPRIFATKKLILQHALASHPVSGKEIKCKVVTMANNFSHHYKRERFECLICSSHHVTKYSLMCHTKSLHPALSAQKYLFRLIEPKVMKLRPLECLHCNVPLMNFTRYKSHIKKHISFKCEECDDTFGNINELKSHIREHKNPEKVEKEPEIFRCVVCDELFANKQELLDHEHIHKERKEVQCVNPKCNKRFNSEYELKVHEKRKHRTSLCEICGKLFELTYMRSHLQTHNIGLPFKCKFENCNKFFKTQSSLFRHRKHHMDINKKTICTVCGKTLSVNSISLHMRIHSHERNEVCDICGSAFYRKDHLRHHRARHSQIGIRPKYRPYECPTCNIKLEGREEYLKHATQVHGIEAPEVPKGLKQPKNLSCVICEKKFSHRCYLEEHYRLHRGERIHKCQICDKSFGTKLTLYQHKLTHLSYEQFRYQCEFCKKRFRRSSQVRDHRRIHTGEKPFPCPICQRPFRVRGEMVKHMRIHVKKEERVFKKKPALPQRIFDDSTDSSTEESSDEERFAKHELDDEERFAEEEVNEEQFANEVDDERDIPEEVIDERDIPEEVVDGGDIPEEVVNGRIITKVVDGDETIYYIEDDSSSIEYAIAEDMPSLE